MLALLGLCADKAGADFPPNWLRCRMRSCLLLAAALPLLSGCIARTALDIATMPVRAAGQAADWATVSQEEADRDLGRRSRARDAQLGRLERQRQRADDACDDGDNRACRTADDLAGPIRDLRDAPL
ncbi:MAG: hypothetical protein ACKOUM_01570 [Sphingopyxis sp.]